MPLEDYVICVDMWKTLSKLGVRKTEMSVIELIGKLAKYSSNWKM